MAEVRPQVVEYRPGMTPAQYLDLFRQGLDQIRESDVQDPDVAVRNYAVDNLQALVENPNLSHAQTDVIRRQKRWIIGTAAAGILVTLLATWGGYNFGYNAGDSNLRPAYRSAVTVRDKANVENAQLKTRVDTLERRVNTQSGEITAREEVIEGFKTEFEKYFGKPPEEKAEEKKSQ